MKKFLMTGFVVALLLVSATALYAGKCEDLGACTLPSGECGAECNGQCMSFSEARCCQMGMCYLNGSWCGGVECDGQCMPPEQAKCCRYGCQWVNGSCQCGSK